MEYLVMFTCGAKIARQNRSMIIEDDGTRSNRKSVYDAFMDVILGTGLENVNIKTVYKLEEVEIKTLF